MSEVLLLDTTTATQMHPKKTMRLCWPPTPGSRLPRWELKSTSYLTQHLAPTSQRKPSVTLPFSLTKVPKPWNSRHRPPCPPLLPLLAPLAPLPQSPIIRPSGPPLHPPVLPYVIPLLPSPTPTLRPPPRAFQQMQCESHETSSH